MYLITLISLILFYILDTLSNLVFTKIYCLKLEKDRKFYSSYVRSFVHALITSIAALYDTYVIMNNTSINFFDYYSPVIMVTSNISIAYFFYDTIYLISSAYSDKKITKETIMYFLHHVVFGIAIYYFSISNYHALITCGLLTEISTTVFGAHIMYRFLAKYYSNQIVLTNTKTNNNTNIIKYYDNIAHKLFILFGTLFGLIRICLIGSLVIYNFNQFYENNIIYVCMFLIVLNSVWFVSIIKSMFNYRFVLVITNKNL
jgi:hypothetical protein